MGFRVGMSIKCLLKAMGYPIAFFLGRQVVEAVPKRPANAGLLHGALSEKLVPAGSNKRDLALGES